MEGMFWETLTAHGVIPQGKAAPSSASIQPTIPLALGTEPFSNLTGYNLAQFGRESLKLCFEAFKD